MQYVTDQMLPQSSILSPQVNKSLSSEHFGILIPFIYKRSTTCFKILDEIIEIVEVAY